VAGGGGGAFSGMSAAIAGPAKRTGSALALHKKRLFIVLL